MDWASVSPHTFSTELKSVFFNMFIFRYRFRTEMTLWSPCVYTVYSMSIHSIGALKFWSMSTDLCFIGWRNSSKGLRLCGHQSCQHKHLWCEQAIAIFWGWMLVSVRACYTVCVCVCARVSVSDCVTTGVFNVKLGTR